MEAHSLPRGGELALPRSRRLLGAYSDDRLVEQVRRGNDAAFETIFDRHHRQILSFCRHMLASQEEGEDAVQHTFVAAYDSLRVGGRDIALKPWLFTIARNRCLSMLRARHEQTAELEDVPTAGLSTAVQQRSDLRDLLADIRELPDDQRAALVLSELGDLSHGDIAQVVGCEASKVKSLVFQARSSLIESRTARDTPCDEIREQISTLRGGALRRGTLRRHIKHCTGCTEFREEVRRQRTMMAAVLPVVPAIGLKQSALAAAGIGGSGAGAAAGGGAGGGLAGLASAGGAVKAAAIVAAAGIAVGGGVVVTQEIQQAISPSGGSHASAPAGDRGAGGGAGGAANGLRGAGHSSNGRQAGGGAAHRSHSNAHSGPGANGGGTLRPHGHSHGNGPATGPHPSGNAYGLDGNVPQGVANGQSGSTGGGSTGTPSTVNHGNGTPAHQNSGQHSGQVKHPTQTNSGQHSGAQNGGGGSTTTTAPTATPAPGPTSTSNGEGTVRQHAGGQVKHSLAVAQGAKP